jgi:non-specific serine/threonine protein kinase
MGAAATREGAPRHNLPPARAALFGREPDLRRVRRALAGARLVTLVGPGGVGKTRLALAAADGLLEGYPDGVWLLELAPLADPGLVPASVAAVLGVREAPGRALAETLAEWLRGKRLLLLLDNCEHVRAACAELAATLLGLAGERRLAVPPLALPSAADVGLAALAATPSVALFVERAQRVEPAFALTEGNAAAIAAVCARLDGPPLAIELAAARVKVRSPRALLAELGERLEVLIGGRRGLPARQRTVRGLLDWSFTLLSPGEQALFARLSAFSGGWTADAAQAVCVIDDDLPMPVAEGLDALVEQSLVVPVRAGRYGMLETVREYASYALERLSAVEDAGAVRRQHLRHFLALAEAAAPLLTGPEQVAWQARLEAEHDNLRAALGWARGQRAAAELRLAGALWRFWEQCGALGEGRAWLEAALAADEGGAPGARAQAANGAGNLARDQGDMARAAHLFEEALTLFRESDLTLDLAGPLGGLGAVALARGDWRRAAAAHAEALRVARAQGAGLLVAPCLEGLALAAAGEPAGDPCRVARLLAAAATLRAAQGAPLFPRDHLRVAAARAAAQALPLEEAATLALAGHEAAVAGE